MSESSCRVWPLVRPVDALKARLDLIDGASTSIDAQYYIWEADASGLLVLDHVLSAADRGVQVRIILDDMHVRSRHHGKAAIDAHPNISLRAYRPFSGGSGAVRQAVEFARDFQDLDHRMHNKLLVVDSVEAIVGGRNIADGHFGLAEECDLVDFDIRAVGPVVADLQRAFDRYWGSASVETVHPHRLSTTARRKVAEELEGHRETLDVALASVDESGGTVYEVPASGMAVVADAPDAQPPVSVIDALRESVGGAISTITAITPFFVPTDNDVAWYRELVDSGVSVQLLTNSLASNEGTISNSGLDSMRRSVIEAGFELYELRPDAAVKPEWETPPTSSDYLGLHGKIYVVDSRIVLLGSVNLDPRSRNINTEMVVRVESEEFAAECEDAFVRLARPRNAWRVTLDEAGSVVWSDDSGSTTTQPSRSRTQAFGNWFFGQLPIGRYI